MVQTFKIKKNDTKPYLAVTLQYSDGTAVDLTSGSVQFNLGDSNFEPIMNGVATITDASAGECEWRWNGTSDTVNVGNFYAEFQATLSDGKIITFPNDHSLKVEIYEDYD